LRLSKALYSDQINHFDDSGHSACALQRNLTIVETRDQPLQDDTTAVGLYVEPTQRGPAFRREEGRHPLLKLSIVGDLFEPFENHKLPALPIFG
jgi:hypothetical protein